MRQRSCTHGTLITSQYNISLDNGGHIFVDGSNPSVVRELKLHIDSDDVDYENAIKHLRTAYGTRYHDINSLKENMLVVPVYFAKYHKAMLAHCKELLEYRQGYMAINPKHDKLITALRTAVENGEGSLDKEATSHDDLFDSNRLSLLAWNLR
jgi:hypothetical protein